MSIKASDLDSDLKAFEREDGTVEDSVNADSLDPYLHQSQGDSFEGEETARVKKFFDYPVLHVFLPWLRALTKGFNALKNTVETKYLKKEKVQEKFDPESADPMSGKAVAEAIETVDPEHLRGALAAIGGYLEVDELYAMSTAVKVAAAAGGEKDIRCFILHTAEDKLYFASSAEVLRCIMSRETDEETGEETMETLVPILDLAANGTLFPKYEVKVEVDPTKTMDIPSEDAKLILDISPAGIMGTIYLWNPETCEEPMMSLREGASCPVTLPDDFADQETAARFWRPGCQVESIYMDEGTKAYFVYSKEQTDHRAISPTRLKEIVAEALEEKTIYLPVANHDETFVVTDEMAESGLAVKVWSNMPYDCVGWSLTYNKNGENHGELYGTDTFSRGEIPVDVRPYVGYTMHFTFYDQDGHGGLAWLKQPVKVGSVSIEKLTALLSGEVSEE